MTWHCSAQVLAAHSGGLPCLLMNLHKTEHLAELRNSDWQNLLEVLAHIDANLKITAVYNFHIRQSS